MPGPTVVLVDDGLATGARVRGPIRAPRGMGGGRLVVAVPLRPRSASREVAVVADELVCATIPESFAPVGQFYADLRPTTAEEVRALLERATSGRG